VSEYLERLIGDKPAGRVTSLDIQQKSLPCLWIKHLKKSNTFVLFGLAMSFLTVAAATLPSVPLDFQGNRDRILESIRIAKQKGATLRTGPEVCIALRCGLLWRGTDGDVA
jgi:hypothetical protein